MFLLGDSLEWLRQINSNSINCVITSPPYFALRDYRVDGQIGLEPTFQQYIARLMEIFDEVKRVLTNDGTCWVVIGDTYGRGDRRHQAKQTFETNPDRHIDMPPKTHFSKSLMMIPQRFGIAMLDHGWILRNDIIWKKNNCMPSSAKDRFTIDYEHILFFTKNKNYYFKTQYEPYSEATIKEFGQVYKGQGLKEYDDNHVQNPSDVKRRIIKSLSKNSQVNEFFDDIAYAKKWLYPSDIKGQQDVEKARQINIAGLKMPPIGGTKLCPDNRTYSGNTPPFQFGRIMRTVWTINPKPFREAHFAVFPPKLVERMIDAGAPPDGIVLDPFSGAGTTCLVAKQMGRKWIGIELNKDYVNIAKKRITS